MFRVRKERKVFLVNSIHNDVRVEICNNNKSGVSPYDRERTPQQDGWKDDHGGINSKTSRKNQGRNNRPKMAPHAVIMKEKKQFLF